LRESGSARVQLRDIDGSPVDKDARAIIPDRYTIPAQLRNAHHNGNGPAKQGVATRSIDRPVHHQR
jgi:hypothetical protein